LLGNASCELYNNVYTFSLDELVGLESLTTSGVKDKIFSLGLGLGNTSIGEVESNIQSRIDTIYKPRGKGKGQLIREILKKIESEKSTLQQIQENLPKYQGLFQEIKRLTQAITELDKKLEELWGEKNKLGNYLKCYESFISITKANEDLQELPEFQDYPEKGIELLDKLEEKEQELIDKIQELHSGTQDEKGIEELEEEIKKSSFDEKLLEDEDKVKYLSKNLEKYKQTISDRNNDEHRLKDYQQSIKQYIGDINAQWTEQNIIEFTDLNTHKNKIEEFKNEFKKVEDDKRDAEAALKAIQAKEGPLNTKNIAVITSIIFFIASIPAFYYGVYVLGGSLLLIALILFLSIKYFLKQSSHVHIQQQLEELKRNEQKLKGEYESYLEQQMKLPKSLSVETALDVFKTIEQLRAKITERNNLKEKLEKERLPFIQEFENEAYPLEDVLQNKKQKDNIEILVIHIIAEFDASKTNSQEKEKLRQELKRKKKELKTAESNLEQTQTQIKNLSNSISAKDQQDFRKKYEENNKVNGLIKERDAAIQTIEKIVGLNKAEEVIKYLAATDKEAIESKISELTNEIESKAQECKKKNNELGEKSNEIKRVEGESELAEVSTELETEKTEIKKCL
jgi:uncharacterized protein YhaN